MEQRQSLITLAETLAAHQGVTHYAISMRALGKGDFFKKLKDNADCRTLTAEKLLAWFRKNWPNDLEWPSGISRPGVAPAPAPLPAAPPVADAELDCPDWWGNVELRVFLTAAHDQITMTEARAEAVLRFGEGVPSLADIHRYWQHLDALREAALKNARRALA